MHSKICNEVSECQAESCPDREPFCPRGMQLKKTAGMINLFIMTEPELWKNVQTDPSNEALHQQYVNACVKYNLEKEALVRYKDLQTAYPALSAKFTKQLTTVLQFKFMPAHGSADELKPKQNLLVRLFGFEYSILLTGVLSLAYGIIAKSTGQALIGIVIIGGFMAYKYMKVKRARR